MSGLERLTLRMAFVSLCVLWFLAVVGGGSFALSHAVNKGEADFTREQKAYLGEAYPHGNFTTPSTYRWCDGNTWVYFNSRGDTWALNERCWRVGG